MNKLFTLLSYLFIFGLIIGGLWYIGDKAYHKYYLDSEKKPFWSGTELIQVCKIPYDSSNDCYKLNVTLLNEKSARINFENGGYVVVEDLTCYFAAQFSNYPRYVFCRSWDSDDQQWDLMPKWAYYPSMEDLMKETENLLKKYK